MLVRVFFAWRILQAKLSFNLFKFFCHNLFKLLNISFFMAIIRETPTLTDCVKAELGKVLYPPVDALCRYEHRTRDEACKYALASGETLALEEPFLADVLRCMYATLRYFEIPDPQREALLERYRHQ